MTRLDGSKSSRGRALAVSIAPLVLIAGCSGASPEVPVAPPTPVADSAPKTPAKAKGVQPGGADYSGKGGGAGGGR